MLFLEFFLLEIIRRFGTSNNDLFTKTNIKKKKFKLTQSMIIFVKLMSGESISLEVEESDTIEIIKLKILKIRWIPFKEVRLVCRGTIL